MTQARRLLAIGLFIALGCVLVLLIWIVPHRDRQTSTAAQAIVAESPERLREVLAILEDETALKEFLKPIPPKEPAEALKTFEAVDGFRMELVAHEPFVNDPIAAAFDENGRLYVAEMRGYPFQPGPGRKPIGRVRLLEDVDGDGRFDKSHVFAEHLLWPSGIAPWKQGVFVAATPDIWYMKDTDGDGVADIRKKVYTGFGHQGEQYMLNNLIWGVDHKIYGATAGNGGTVRPADDPNAEPIPVSGRDFRFDPVTGAFETTTETFQFGNTFDNWYNRFVGNQGMPVRHAVLPGHYMARNPYLPSTSGINALVHGWTRLYKISPIEAWRSVRRARRIAAGRDPTSPGVDHNYLTAGAGVTVYRGDAYPKKYHGNVFIGAATGNLVHRRVLTPDGVTFGSDRADENTDFVRSTDNWFRPVNFVNAPDGTLYVLDMSRELIESVHVATKVIKHLDLTHGRDRGRIYRMAPPGFRVPSQPRLGDAATKELVEQLENPTGWWRETAHRLIYERQDQSAVGPLRHLLNESSRPLARMHALWSLQGLDALTNADIARSLSDTIAGVREHAVQLAEPRLNDSAELLEKVLGLVGDKNPRVRLQVAFTLGEVKDRRAISALAEIAKQDAGDRWIRAAVLSSSAESADSLLMELVKDRVFIEKETGASLLSRLARVVGARNRPGEVQLVLNAAASHPNLTPNPWAQEIVVTGLAEGLNSARTTLADVKDKSPQVNQMLEDLLKQARSTAMDDQAEPERRLQAVRVLSHGSYDQVRKPLAALIQPRQPQSLQLAAIAALTRQNEPEVAPILLQPWEAYTPEVRRNALEQLLSQEQWTLSLLKAIESGQRTMIKSAAQPSASEIDPTRRSLLMEHRNESIRTLAKKLFAEDTLAPRNEVLAAYRQALALEGNQTRGEKVYRRECIDCHLLGTNETIGPNLLMGSYQDPEALLGDILDPNRYVAPEYIKYVVNDREGRVHTGMIAAETATSIVLQRGHNDQDTIFKSNIEQIRNTGKSLMPEGMEYPITQQEMADLIKFILDAQYDPGTDPGVLAPTDEK